MKMFVISTPNDQVRANRLKNELAAQTDISKMDITAFKAIMTPNSARIGISKTHRAIVQHAKEQDWFEVMILEDDIKFLHKDALIKLQNIFKMLPKDCDLFFAGVYDGKITNEYSIYSQLEGQISGLHCYVVKSKFYNKFLSADPEYNLDFCISTTLNPKMYCADPFLAIQHDGYSYNAGQEMNYNYNLHTKYNLSNGE